MNEKEKDFNPLFNEWASSYDQTVEDKDGEYNEVFENYADILAQIVGHLPQQAGRVLEFGVGTGNLTQQLVHKGHTVIGVEPSVEMRKVVQQKGIEVDLREGHFLDIPMQEEEKVDAIVSSYAFHHLTLREKQRALESLKKYMQAHTLIIFADTSFEDEGKKLEIMERAERQGKPNLLEDLKTEFYETIEDLEEIYKASGFDVDFEQKNRYVWISVAKLSEK
ncbi:class I SAM-dependent DNA methyltransferase [Bacillus horti]|uniref:Cyclopropane fatty-acyl-phospholipid synthase-like methyltransferase n=1 Tax=Caldalkalibacillus horti TaxID=77523 RepID=A0ABT9W0J0_9BACI|nr:class I SAM-dependent methyltransferase [Bacillus horti]MDQ0166791.1 cyclopropane fatty-acyl-phospholipid synthase-like methyltransferase [Bacillus horti]